MTSKPDLDLAELRRKLKLPAYRRQTPFTTGDALELVDRLEAALLDSGRLDTLQKLYKHTLGPNTLTFKSWITDLRVAIDAMQPPPAEDSDNG